VDLALLKRIGPPAPPPARVISGAISGSSWNRNTREAPRASWWCAKVSHSARVARTVATTLQLPGAGKDATMCLPAPINLCAGRSSFRAATQDAARDCRAGIQKR